MSWACSRTTASCRTESTASILKHAQQLSDAQLAFLLHDSQYHRRFARLSFCWTPSAFCVHENISRIQPGTWQQINRLLVQWANRQGLERGRKNRVDAKAVESPIRFPLDSQLLDGEVVRENPNDIAQFQPWMRTPA